MRSGENTRKIAMLSVMAGLSVAFVFIIHFPIFTDAPFLEYDPADIPVLIATFAYGPLCGILIAVAAAVVQGITVSMQGGFYGILMHIISTGSFLLTAGLIYKSKHTRSGAVIGLLCGIVVSTGVMACANWLVTPIYLSGVTGMLPEVARDDVVKGMLLSAIVPFNLIKSGVNGVVTLLIYERISKLIKTGWNVEIKDFDQNIE